MYRNKRLNSQNNIKAKEPDQHKWTITDKSLEVDPCDCPYEECPGCWYPCETCGSTKCSAFCRKMREDKTTLQWSHTC